MTARPLSPRYFHLRASNGFDEELFNAVRRGCERWRAWVEETLAGWETHERRKFLPKPTYVISEPHLSDDRKTITITLEGDPITHGAMMLFEDQVPPELYGEIPQSRLLEIDVAYENRDLKALGQTELRWHPVDV